MEPILIRIVRCSDALMWYRDKVGTTVEAIGEEADMYWARDDGGYKNIVWKKDCEIIESHRIKMNPTIEGLAKQLEELTAQVEFLSERISQMETAAHTHTPY